MVFSFFRRKKEISVFREEVQESFKHVRKDVNKIGDWIRHIDDKNKNIDEKIEALEKEISHLKEEISIVTGAARLLGQTQTTKQVKQPSNQTTKQQTAVDVQTVVQTAVQTAFLEKLTIMERGIVWSLLNTDLKLSHEDISALLGKDKSTIRGQINSIKQKLPSLISEIQESNGKKRLYIEDAEKKEILQRIRLKIAEKKEK